MSELVTKQQKFSLAVSLLANYAYYEGFKITFGECWRRPDNPHGHPNSTHKSRLAVDLNVFIEDDYLQGEQAEEAHNKLHDFWDMLGGSERIKQDLNHYSFEHNGVR